MKLVNGKYLLEINDVINNSEFNEEDLKEVFGEKIEYYLKNFSEKTYSIAYNAYRGIHRERQRIWLNWFIQQTDDRQNAMRDAQIEYVRGAVYSGMDLQDYLPSSSIEERTTNKASYPPMLRNILYDNGLWVLSTIQYRDEELV